VRKELDPRLVIFILILVVAVIGFAAWKLWAVPSGLRTPKEAGLGRPMKPGEIPGKRQGVGAPIGPPR